MNDRFQRLRLIEALLFASDEPLGRADFMRHLPEDVDLPGLLGELSDLYANRGVNLVQVGDRWAFRTAPDLGPAMRLESKVRRKLSRAAIETLAVIAYHQPVTRAEIEEIRGVGLSKGTLDVLLEAGWIKPRGRRRVPGRPITWGTSPAFLDHFGLESLEALPGRDELRAAGLLDTRPAVAVLAAGGGPVGEEGGEGRSEDDEDEPLGEDDEALAETFGEDLVGEDEEGEAESPADGASVQNDDAGQEEEGDAGSDEEEAEEQERPQGPRAVGGAGEGSA